MPTARATLAAEHRELTGKKVARLRHAGALAGGRLRPRRRLGQHLDRCPRVRAAAPAHRPERPGRPVRRRRQGPAGAGLLGPGPPGQSPGAPRGPLPRADDRGADGRRPACRNRRVVGDRRPRRDAAPPDRVRPHPGTARSSAAGHRVLDRVAHRLRHDDPRARPRHPRGRDPDDRRRRDRGQGPGPARRGGAGRGRGRDRRGRARGGRGAASSRPARARAAAPTRADRPRAGGQRERRPDAKTIEKRIVIRSADRRPRRRRSVPISRLRTSGSISSNSVCSSNSLRNAM